MAAAGDIGFLLGESLALKGGRERLPRRQGSDWSAGRGFLSGKCLI